MDISKDTIIAQIRKAIDDIAPDTVDSFTTDTDEELWQAVQHAVQFLLMELPLDLLESTPSTPTVSDQNGVGTVSCPNDFLRFVSLKLPGWSRPVYDLIEPGSEEELRQSSKWSMGTVDKPRAMLDHGSTGKAVIRYWAAYTGPTSAGTASFLYIPTPSEENDTITCALREPAEPMVIYRAASIFFEGKKEPETAEKFKNL